MRLWNWCGVMEAIRKRFDLLILIPGIAAISALQLLGELAPLSPEMSVRQWVAHSGLDPSHQVSGTSVHKPSRISRAGILASCFCVRRRRRCDRRKWRVKQEVDSCKSARRDSVEREEGRGA
jgi:transposase